MQRAEDKNHLPTMVKYLKSYMNFNPAKYAHWFLQQFCNPDILKECFFENPNKLMRSIMTGLLYCAMLKVYDIEKSQLGYFKVDMKANAPVKRQTVMGNLVLLVLHMLPQLRAYNKNHSAIL